MSKNTAEILLIISATLFASLLLFLAEPMRRVMNKMDNGASKQIISLLFQIGPRSPFLYIATNLTGLAMIPYFIFFGFSNWWFTAGLAVLLVAGGVAKVVKVPIYKTAKELDAEDPKWLAAQNKWHNMNLFQAVFTCLAVSMMTIGLFY
jgi:hypothetical protein